ncbi:MAG: AAA family ATPase [Pseudomonadota bacterium]
MSHRHKEALAHLLYGMGEMGSFVLLTGEIGTGKTTLCRSLLEQVPEGVEVALVLNPKQTSLELVGSVCDELDVSYPVGTESLKVLVDQLNLHLLETHSKGGRTVLIIDEAQNLSTDVLEQVRLLTNLETTKQKLLQILLIGQPELQDMMARPELRQLGQRITARYHLAPLLPNETSAYVQHRLEVVGCKRELFSKAALRKVHRLSGGVPRLINIICDRALLGAYAKKLDRIDPGLVRRSASEVMGLGWQLRHRGLIRWALVVLVLILLGAGWKFLPWPNLLGDVLETLKGTKTAGQAPVIERKARDVSPEPRPEPKETKKEATPPKDRGVEAAKKEAIVASEPVPKKVPPEGVVGPPNLGRLLRSGGIKSDRETAFSTLFRNWHLEWPDPSAIPPCEYAPKAALRCLKGKGTWTNLCHLNRPAVLELIDNGQERHYVVAAFLEDGNVTLDLGSERVTVPRTDIEPYWFGDFTIVWRPLPSGSILLREGDKGSDVLWLRARLDRVEGVTPGSGGKLANPLFDADLKMRVMNFQRSHSINPDGMVGEQTIIQLNTTMKDPSIPLLCRSTQ